MRKRIEDLKLELNNAIQIEDYDLCSKLKNIIDKLEEYGVDICDINNNKYEYHTMFVNCGVLFFINNDITIDEINSDKNIELNLDDKKYMINILYNKDIEKTSDCVNILNKYKKGTWKRVSKFKLNTGTFSDEKSVVRVFRNNDDNDVVTIVYDGLETLFCKELDLSKYRGLFKKLDKINKNYHTVDYGEVFFNPYTHDLHLVVSDGGGFKSTESSDVLIRKIEEGEIDFDDNIDDYAIDLDEINNVVIEAEYYPHNNNLTNFIQIGNINTLDF